MKVFDDDVLVAACQYHRLDDNATAKQCAITVLYDNCHKAGQRAEQSIAYYAGRALCTADEPYDLADGPLHDGGCIDSLPEGWLPTDIRQKLHDSINTTTLDFVQFVNEIEGHATCKRLAIESMLEGKMWFNTAIAARYPVYNLPHTQYGYAAQALAAKWAVKAITLSMVLNRSA